MIYMPGGRSLVNNSIFNLVLMLAGFSPTSIPFPLHSRLSLALPPVLFTLRFRATVAVSARRVSLFFFPLFISLLFLSFYSSALIPPRRRPDKGEISTASVNKFLHRRPSLPRTFRVRASRNQKRWNLAKRKRERIRQISLF